MPDEFKTIREALEAIRECSNGGPEYAHAGLALAALERAEGKINALHEFMDSENGGAEIVHPGTDDDTTTIRVSTEAWDGLCESMKGADPR